MASEQLGFFWKEREHLEVTVKVTPTTGSMVLVERGIEKYQLARLEEKLKGTFKKHELQWFCQGQTLQSSGCCGRHCKVGEGQGI